MEVNTHDVDGGGVYSSQSITGIIISKRIGWNLLHEFDTFLHYNANVVLSNLILWS
jgi:hypothetical protein